MLVPFDEAGGQWRSRSTFPSSECAASAASAGGEPRRLTHAPSQDGHGLWSADGRFVYYLADHAVLWRVPFYAESGEAGEPRKVWEPGHRIDYLHLAPDDRTLYFTVPRSGGDVWRLTGLRHAAGRADAAPTARRRRERTWF